ncbi:MAG: hypothetical protein EP315_06255 [Gammaproteobacteria bacterium]|nr:MAG: hypothetical protein EP315_06255 [Gammaproteobacteria bacterium]
MKFYIKVGTDETVSLMTETGQVLGCFASVYEALQICEDQYLMNPAKTTHEICVHSQDIKFLEQQYAIAV